MSFSTSIDRIRGVAVIPHGGKKYIQLRRKISRTSCKMNYRWTKFSPKSSTKNILLALPCALQIGVNPSIFIKLGVLQLTGCVILTRAFTTSEALLLHTGASDELIVQPLLFDSSLLRLYKLQVLSSNCPPAA
jgi:hypothetical protein